MAHPYQLGLEARLWLNILQVFAGMLFYLVHIVSQLCRFRVCDSQCSIFYLWEILGGSIVCRISSLKEDYRGE
jgi:hypothetical protein